MSQTTSVEKKVRIPEVPSERIEELSKRIKPVVRFSRRGFFMRLCVSADGKPFFIKKVDLFGIAFTWSPKPTKRARGLKQVVDITTYHTWGYYGCFKPSIAEVLAQIPDEYVYEVNAFEIVDSPKTSADLCRYPEELNEGYHVATTRLYIY